MLQRAFFAVCVAALCAGQMCGVPADSGLPIPDGSGQMGIPAGVYSGKVTATITMTFVGVDGNVTGDPATSTYTLTREFGAHGGPMTADGLPLGPGDSTEEGDITVESVFIDVGKVIVVEEHSHEMPGFEELFGETIHLTGIETITYTYLGGGQIRYDAEACQTSQIIGLEYLRVVSETTGILSR